MSSKIQSARLKSTSTVSIYIQYHHEKYEKCIIGSKIMSELFKNHYYLIEEKRLIFNQLSRLLVRVGTSSIWINIFFGWYTFYMAEQGKHSREEEELRAFVSHLNWLNLRAKRITIQNGIPRVYYMENVFEVNFHFGFFICFILSRIYTVYGGNLLFFFVRTLRHNKNGDRLLKILFW